MSNEWRGSTQVDATVGTTAVELVAGVRDARSLRERTLNLAIALREGAQPRDRAHRGDEDANRQSRGASPDITRVNRGLLVLIEPNVSENRLHEEWARVQSLLQPDIASRLHYITVAIDGALLDKHAFHAGELTPALLNALRALVRDASLERGRRRPMAQYVVLRTLLIKWFRREGAVTMKTLGTDTGFSYPTLARVLHDLEEHVQRLSDRRVRLTSFPDAAWRKLASDADEFRRTEYYHDPSSYPRSPKVLLDRVLARHEENVAIGGIPGANACMPTLDLTGLPRVDLTVHCPKPGQLERLPGELDPGLVRASSAKGAHLAIHVMEQPLRTFTRGRRDVQYADELDCILDLQSAGYEGPSLDLLEYLKRRAET